MGIDTETARFLLSSRRDGVSFRRCATLGRQNLFLGNRECAGLLREYGIDPASHPKLFAEAYSRFRYSEAFWEAIGVSDLAMIDASDYEGANIVHDLNQPIPPTLEGRFDAVCDFGTLEHIFHFPVALRNCLSMVAEGGRFFAQTPANNLFGHGFYQFSPELFYRVLSERNGYRVERMIAVEYGPRHRWFDVGDPGVLRARVALINSFPVMLFIRAQRVAIKPVLQSVPQQSDCEAQWEGKASPAQSGVIDTLAADRFSRWKQRLLENAPRLARSLEAFRYSIFNRDWTFRNRRSFRPIPRDRR